MSKTLVIKNIRLNEKRLRERNKRLVMQNKELIVKLKSAYANIESYSLSLDYYRKNKIHVAAALLDASDRQHAEAVARPHNV